MSNVKNPDGFTLVEIMIVVVIIGLLAALAIPAFQRVRIRAQNQSVINNVRQLTSAADQYYMENGVTTVAFTNITAPGTYIKNFATVANENYPSFFTQAVTVTVTGISGTRDMTFPP